MTKAIRFFYSLLFLITPLIFTSFNSELFELPKMYFVYTVTLIILSLHLLNYLNKKIILFRHTFLDFSLILFLISQSISTFFSIDPHTSLFGYYSRLNGGLLSLVCYLILYWILAIYINNNFKEKIISWSLISGTLIALYGITEHFGIDKHIWSQDVQNRVFSTMGQPNWLAAYLCILLPFSISKFPKKKAFIPFTKYYMLNTVLFTCLLFTKSKSGIIATIISLSIYFILNFFKKSQFLPLIKGRCPKDKGVLIIILILFTTLSFTINNPIKDKLSPKKHTISNLKSEKPRSDILITPSEDIRKIVWKGSIDLWKRNPFIGTGVETFAYSYYWTRPIEHNLTSEWDFLYNKAHNEYLNYLATTGTLGLLSYLSIIVCVLIFIFKNLRPACPAGGSDTYNLQSIILASYISILITNFAGFSVVITSVFFFLLPIFLIENKKIENTKKTPSKYFSILVIFLFFYLLQKVILSFFADIAYAKSEAFDNKDDYQNAYNQIKISLNFRPSEPVYLDKISSLTARLAIATDKKEYSEKFIQESIYSSNKALEISPANTNFWKERAQTFYYLSSVDTKYFPEIIKSLETVTHLAPTDAKAFFMIGRFLEAGNLQNEAIVYYEKAILLKPNYDHALFALGKIYFDQKHLEKAKSNFEKVLLFAPSNPDAKNYLEKIQQKTRRQ